MPSRSSSKSFNPNADALLNYVGRFRASWRSELEGFLNDEERLQSVNSLVGVRNQIAHGKNQGIDIRTVREYRAVVDSIVNRLLDHFDPAP